MNRILDEIVPIIFGALVALFTIGLGWLIRADMDRFEHCIAADMQWVRAFTSRSRRSHRYGFVGGDKRHPRRD